MIMAMPTPERFISGVAFPVTNGNFLSLVAANIGAVVMPWMIFLSTICLGSSRSKEKRS